MTRTPLRKLDGLEHPHPERPLAILQFGSGNFLRGFVDWMISRLNKSGLTDVGIAMAYATNKPRRDDPLVPQGGNYHVILDGMKAGNMTRSVELIDVIDRIVDPYADWAALVDIATSSDLKVIVSNTTEAGLRYSQMDTGGVPDSFPGMLARLLYERFLSGGEGVAIVPCELIEQNGSVLLTLLVQHAAEADFGEGFVEWLMDECHFYDTLVDRIVSGYPTNADELHQELGMIDRAMVQGEAYSLWVIGGDEYLRSALPLDQLDVGVRFVPRDEVDQIRVKKVRILNGSHTAMAQLGLLAGKRTVFDAYSDPAIRGFIESLLENEILPSLDGAQEELESFASGITERFANPSLDHQLYDIELNSLSKWRSRNLPVLTDLWLKGMPAPRTVFVLAAMLCLYSGHAAPGFVPQDDKASIKVIQETFDADDLTGWVSSVIPLLDLGPAWDTDIPKQQLVDQLATAISRVLEQGVLAALP